MKDGEASTFQNDEVIMDKPKKKKVGRSKGNKNKIVTDKNKDMTSTKIMPIVVNNSKNVRIVDNVFQDSKPKNVKMSTNKIVNIPIGKAQDFFQKETITLWPQEPLKTYVQMSNNIKPILQDKTNAEKVIKIHVHQKVNPGMCAEN